MNTITYEDFLDKIHGCWYGKCLGGAAGAPVEGIKEIIDTDDFEAIFNPDLPNDDLDIQLLWLEVLEKKGANITPCDLADAWLEKCWYPFSEYGYFMKNYERGIKPPYSGIINNSFFKEGMGCPIRSEIWAVISAGNPSLAAQYAYNDACLDHADNSVYAEQFLAAAQSIAFFENDIETIIKKALEYIPSDCKLRECIEYVTACFKKGESYLDTRKLVLARYSHPDFTNVVQNLAFVTIGLLYGGGDMRKTINLALKCGYDTDCTCASAASLVGIAKGYKGLGEELTGLIKDYFVCGIDVQRPSDSIRGLAEDSAKAALSIDNDCLTVTDIPEKLKNIKKTKPELENSYPTEEGLKEALASINPIKWKVYGPYFSQPNWPMNPNYPSPHGEGCVLPDIVCMVNNEVFLDKEYIDEKTLEMPEKDYISTIDSYEDKINLEDTVTMQGQMCIYLEAEITSPQSRQAWFVVGNTDGFKMWLNGEEILSKDEMRIYTPYNNFCLADLKEGKNKIVLKLLRRVETVDFALGIRKYDGNHWHRSKWHTDIF